MRTLIANPAGDTCQRVDPYTKKRCTAPRVTGRGQCKFCLDCREKRNADYQREWRKDHPGWQERNQWYVVRHRIRKGMAVRDETIVRHFLRQLKLSLPKALFDQLHLVIDEQAAAINFHVILKNDSRPLTLTFFDPSSMGHWLGVRYVIQFMGDNVISRTVARQLGHNERYGRLKTFVDSSIVGLFLHAVFNCEEERKADVKAAITIDNWSREPPLFPGGTYELKIVETTSPFMTENDAWTMIKGAGSKATYCNLYDPSTKEKITWVEVDGIPIIKGNKNVDVMNKLIKNYHMK